MSEKPLISPYHLNIAISRFGDYLPSPTIPLSTPQLSRITHLSFHYTKVLVLLLFY